MSRYQYTLVLTSLLLAFSPVAQQPSQKSDYPKEVRGYKVHRAQVEMKRPEKPDKKSDKKAGEQEYDETEPLLVRLGEAQLVSVSPLGVTFDLPVILAAVKQQGDVDRLVFENMVVNETPITLDDHVHSFKLPNKEPLTLTPPLRIFVSTPQAVLRTIDNVFNTKDVWQISGRIYVCGHFKKYFLKFKRAVPVEIQTSINNPMK